MVEFGKVSFNLPKLKKVYQIKRSIKKRSARKETANIERD